MPRRRALSRSTAASCRQLVQRRDHDHAAGPHLRRDPGVEFLDQRLAGAACLARGVGVGGRDDVRCRRRPLPKHGVVDAEKLADAAQRVLDLAVHLVGRQVDEPGGEVGDQRLELETVLKGISRRTLFLSHQHWVESGMKIRLAPARVYHPAGSGHRKARRTRLVEPRRRTWHAVLPREFRAPILVRRRGHFDARCDAGRKRSRPHAVILTPLPLLGSHVARRPRPRLRRRARAGQRDAHGTGETERPGDGARGSPEDSAGAARLARGADRPLPGPAPRPDPRGVHLPARDHPAPAVAGEEPEPEGQGPGRRRRQAAVGPGRPVDGGGPRSGEAARGRRPVDDRPRERLPRPAERRHGRRAEDAEEGPGQRRPEDHRAAEGRDQGHRAEDGHRRGVCQPRGHLRAELQPGGRLPAARLPVPADLLPAPTPAGSDVRRLQRRGHVGRGIWGGACCACGWGGQQHQHQHQQQLQPDQPQHERRPRPGGRQQLAAQLPAPRRRARTPTRRRRTSTAGRPRGELAPPAPARRAPGSSRRAAERAPSQQGARTAGGASASNRSAGASAGSRGASPSARGGGFGGGSGGFSGSSARASSSRGASSFGGRGGGGRRR